MYYSCACFYMRSIINRLAVATVLLTLAKLKDKQYIKTIQSREDVPQELCKVVNINLWAHKVCHWCGRINVKFKRHEYFSHPACLLLCLSVCVCVCACVCVCVCVCVSTQAGASRTHAHSELFTFACRLSGEVIIFMCCQLTDAWIRKCIGSVMLRLKLNNWLTGMIYL